MPVAVVVNPPKGQLAKFQIFDSLIRTMQSEPKFPRKIYSLWLQGLDQAPAMVQANWHRWQALNPDYEMVILDKDAALSLTGDLPVDISDISPQAGSDLIRIALLRRYGGVWVDASAFPVRPLADWLEPLVAQSGFFAFAYDGQTRPLASWFLAAGQGSLLANRWADRMDLYWASPHEYAPDPGGPKLLDGDPIAEMRLDDPVPSRQRPYFWMHYLFYYLLERDGDFRRAWEACTKLGAPQAHALQSLNRRRLHYAGRHPGKSCLKAIVHNISGDPALARAVHARFKCHPSKNSTGGKPIQSPR